MEALAAVDKAKADALAEGTRQGKASLLSQLETERAAWQQKLDAERAAGRAAQDKHSSELASMRVMAASLQREALASEEAAAELSVRPPASLCMPFWLGAATLTSPQQLHCTPDQKTKTAWMCCRLPTPVSARTSSG